MKKDNKTFWGEKKSMKMVVGDFFYELNRKVFPPSKKKKDSAVNMKRRQTGFLIFLLAIPVVHWLIFWLYVNLQSFVLAFQSYTIDGSEFTLDNFKEVWRLITSPVNNTLGIALVNTLKYFSTTVLIIIPLCLVVSFFFYKKIMGYKAFRVVFYLPAIISSLVMVTAYSEFIDPNGPLCALLRAMGVEVNERSMLARPETATNTIIVYTIWTGMTTNVLLFSGGMARVPVEVLEAAKLDGVGPGRELVNIIFPLIWPTFSTQLIFTMTGLFSAGGPILLFTKGQYDTTTVAFWIFARVYGDVTSGAPSASMAEYNIVSCAGMCFTAVGVPLILGARKLLDKIEAVEY